MRRVPTPRMELPMTILLAEPHRGGWVIADLAGREWQPGVIYLTKRLAVAAIRVATEQQNGREEPSGRVWIG